MPERTVPALVLICALAVLAGGAAAGDEPIPDPAGLAASGGVPAGWSRAGSTEIYEPATLYEYCNGAARFYLSFGFRRLAHVRLEPDESAEAAGGIDLDVYHMGSELGAYGIYTNTRPPEAGPRAWGSEGYRSGRVAAAWKGVIYVHAEAGSDDAATFEVLEHLATRVIDAAPGEAGLPAMASLLPRDGLVRNSDRYVPRDLLGHSFLPGGLLADYELEGEEYRLFVCDLGSTRAATDALSGLKRYEAAEGRLLGEESDVGDDGFRAEDPGLGLGVVIRNGPHVAGVWGGAGGTAARRLLAKLAGNLGLSGVLRRTTVRADRPGEGTKPLTINYLQ